MLSLALLGGCATREKLARADRPEQIVLAEKVSYVVHSLNGTRWEHIALPGVYEAERKDANGVYFYGVGRSIVQITELYKNELRLKVGGIYLPDDPAKPAEMIYAFETEVHSVPDLDQYMRDRVAQAGYRPAPALGGPIGPLGMLAVDAMLEAGVGEISRLPVKDRATSDKLRSGRRSAPPTGSSQPRASAIP